jgi:hypothetical protein
VVSTSLDSCRVCGLCSCAIGLTWAALGGFSEATDAAAPQPTCGCGQVAHDEATPHLVEGDVVEFVVSTQIAAEIRQRLLEGAFLIVTGPSRGSAYVGDCDSDNSAPIQSAIVTAAGGEPAFKIEELMPVSRDEPLQPGRRLSNFTDLGLCTGTAFTKFRAAVE